jgi:hypothetical protein
MRKFYRYFNEAKINEIIIEGKALLDDGHAWAGVVNGCGLRLSRLVDPALKLAGKDDELEVMVERSLADANMQDALTKHLQKISTAK